MNIGRKAKIVFPAVLLLSLTYSLQAENGRSGSVNSPGDIWQPETMMGSCFGFGEILAESGIEIGAGFAQGIFSDAAVLGVRAQIIF